MINGFREWTANGPLIWTVVQDKTLVVTGPTTVMTFTYTGTAEVPTPAVPT